MVQQNEAAAGRPAVQAALQKNNAVHQAVLLQAYKRTARNNVSPQKLGLADTCHRVKQTPVCLYCAANPLQSDHGS